jgi:HAE1 family hydrophobic/amphiphilic exporter-1
MLMYVNFLVRIKIPDQKFLYNYAISMSELKRVNGVGSGDILGTRDMMRIWLKPDRMLV